MQLTAEERALLSKLSRDQLVFLSGIADDKNADTLIQIVNFFKDIEKDQFFKTAEVDEKVVASKLQFSRGSIAGLVKFVHIVGGSKQELQKREEERKNARKKDQ